MSGDKPKEQPGVFRLKDLDEIELDDQPLFVSTEHEPVDDSGGLVSEGAAEEMVAAIRRARTLHSREFDRPSNDPEVSGIHSLLEVTPELLEKLREPDEPKSDESDGEAETGPNLDGATSPSKRYQTAQADAVIQQARAESARRSRTTMILMVGVPLVLVAVTATVVGLMLLGNEAPPIDGSEFPIRPVAVERVDNALSVVTLLPVPEPEPEPDPAALEAERRAAEEAARRERRRRERERQRQEPVLDRSQLF